jgi:hypothetical protein
MPLTGQIRVVGRERLRRMNASAHVKRAERAVIGAIAELRVPDVIGIEETTPDIPLVACRSERHRVHIAVEIGVPLEQ